MKTAHNIIMTLCVIAVVIGLCGSENPDGSVNPIGVCCLIGGILTGEAARRIAKRISRQEQLKSTSTWKITQQSSPS